MIRNFRIALIAASSAAVLFAMSTPSYASFHWFRFMCGGCGQPAAAAPALIEAPLAAPTVVNYVPQTCYRTQYVTVPVTTYRPTTGCDPCTGCPIPTMRPVVSYVQPARLVPSTTSRPGVARRDALLHLGADERGAFRRGAAEFGSGRFLNDRGAHPGPGPYARHIELPATAAHRQRLDGR